MSLAGIAGLNVAPVGLVRAMNCYSARAFESQGYSNDNGLACLSASNSSAEQQSGWPISPSSPVAGNFSEVIASTSDKCLAEVEHVVNRSPAGPSQGALPHDLNTPAGFFEVH